METALSYPHLSQIIGTEPRLFCLFVCSGTVAGRLGSRADTEQPLLPAAPSAGRGWFLCVGQGAAGAAGGCYNTMETSQQFCFGPAVRLVTVVLAASIYHSTPHSRLTRPPHLSASASLENAYKATDHLISF